LYPEFLCKRRWWMLPMHALPLGLRLIVVNPGLITCDDLLHKVVTFFAMSQVAWTNI
jgi:hypothetical protein